VSVKGKDDITAEGKRECSAALPKALALNIVWCPIGGERATPALKVGKKERGEGEQLH